MLRLLLVLAAFSQFSASPIAPSLDRHALFAPANDLTLLGAGVGAGLVDLPPPPAPPAPPVCDKPPITLSISGGGFRPMFNAFGLGRALAVTELVDEIEGVGCNSGGCWFLAQWAYSKSTFDALSNADVALPDFITEWGMNYGKWWQEQISNEAPWINFDPFDDVSVGAACKLFKKNITNVVNFLYSKVFLPLSFPALEWEKFVSGMLIATNPELTANMKFDAKRSGFSKASLLMETALTPDSWLTSNNKDVTTLLSDGEELGDKVVPVAYQHPAIATDSGWYHEPSKAELSTKLPGKKAEQVPLELDSAPYLLEVTGGASSIGGVFSCQTGMKGMIDQFFTGALVAAKPTAKACLPYGFEQLAAPLLEPGVTFNAVTMPLDYRLLDGAYYENTAMAFTLGKKTRECDHSGGCVDPISAITYDDGMSTDTTLEQGQSLRLLFAAKERPPGTYAPDRYTGVLQVPSPAAFEEEYPPTDEWKEYARAPVTRNGTTHMVVSKYWEGVVTTIENVAYGIKGGYKVNLLILAMDIPFTDQFILLPPAAAGADYWRDRYGMFAHSQAEGLVPVLKEWHNNLPCATK